MGYYTKGQKLTTKSDVVTRSEGNWGMRNINNGRITFTFEEERWSERRNCFVSVGKMENGAYFEWPTKDVTDNPDYVTPSSSSVGG